MAPKLLDRAIAAREDLHATLGPPESEKRLRTARKPGERPSGTVPPALTPHPEVPTGAAAEGPSFEERLKADFRLFLIVIWRHLLGIDPAPIMLDMAYWLQHGPDRSIIQAFRGFSKSWITGAYALWRLYCNPQEKILVVSGSLTRAVATTNWCLALILEVPILKHLAPLPHQRQSSKAFDVGPAKPDQSPSFHALGIGGQIVGFRGDCIIPDDVETQTNSITVTMRDKIREAVKEFDSVLKPGGVIKYLGTPHDEDSLYNKLNKDAGYALRIWPARYPNPEQIKKYGDKLAPYISGMLGKHGPGLVGTSTMPTRFTDEDLAKRELSLGRSEFALQFMLDTSLSDQDKYPLKVHDLMVLSLDHRRGPDSVVWSGDPQHRILDLPSMGFDGDYYHKAIVPDGVPFSPWTRVVGAVDNSGKGKDETALVVVAELNGNLYLLHLWAGRAGYEKETLQAIAKACIQFGINKLRLETNFGDGMFTALFTPVLNKAWEVENKRRLALRHGMPMQAHLYPDGGTEIEDVRVSNLQSKEKRILSILEPVLQQHRLVVNRQVIEWDYESISKMDGSDTRHRYALGHQLTHLTRERESLDHDDRLDALATAAADFADILGVDPDAMALRAAQEREERHLEELLGLDDESGLAASAEASRGVQDRAQAFRPQSR